MVELRPMTPEELASWIAGSIPSYAAEHVRVGDWDEAGSVERARREHDQLLPKGVETPDHYLRTIRADGTGERVGELWYHHGREGHPQLFIFWIGIDPAHRRRGYASEVLRWVDREAARLGVDRVSLHVFGGNPGAEALYRRHGFAVNHLGMSKRLADRSTDAPGPSPTRPPAGPGARDGTATE